MSMARSGRMLVVLATGSVLLGLVPALAQQLDFTFMPKGGKTLLIEALGQAPKAAEVGAIVGARRTEAEWREAMAPRTKGLSDREIKTLAAYLAVNMPVPNADGVAAKAVKPDELSAALPRDGRELAWNECQFCHSLFTSHLTQAREVQAWLNMFQSPFHRGLKMTEQERREFATYSAINMPMRAEDVPADLRF
jgi:mono/diheme cytochrome c family protein